MGFEDLNRGNNIVETIWGTLPIVDKLDILNTYQAPSPLSSGRELQQFAKEMRRKEPRGWNVYGNMVNTPHGDGTIAQFDGINLTVLFNRADIGGALAGEFVNYGNYGVVWVDVNGVDFPLAVGTKILDENDRVSVVGLRQRIMGDGPEWVMEVDNSPRVSKIFDWDLGTRTYSGDFSNQEHLDSLRSGRRVVVGTNVHSDYYFCADMDGWRPYEWPNQHYLVDYERGVGYLFADACYIWD